MNDRTKKTAYFLIPVMVLGTGMCIFAGWNAYRVNGAVGFPLDDPWIHLQFAKNLHEYGSYSYYQNQTVTSGSTSPLYTLLLAAGFSFTSNEFLLSYSLGIVFFALSAWMLYALAKKILGTGLFAAAAALLVLLEPRLEWVADSGMETTLFLFMLLAVHYFYTIRRPLRLGIAGGLAIWTRPEALLFLVIIAIDAAYRSSVLRRNQPKRKGTDDSAWLIRSGLVAAGIGCAYVGFNLWLSGSLFPNTYAAKIKYYSGGGSGFPQQVFGFLTDGHLRIFCLLVATGVVSVLRSVLRLRPDDLLISLLWPIGLFLVYWLNLPYLYQEGRYLMPILPFVILLGLRGVGSLLELGKKIFRGLGRPRTELMAGGFLILVFGVQFAAASWEMKDTYAEYCRYIGERQVRTARWIHDNLPAGSVVATHDVGAIAYYSDRKIVDMVGLVSPEMINNIGNLDKLKQYLVRKKVTHLALLRNWFEVVNENPLFQTDESHPEIMEVFPFDPARAHFTPQLAGRMSGAAASELSARNVDEAGRLLRRSLEIDPQSSKTHLLLGRAYFLAGNLGKASEEVQTALRLHPQYWDAQSASAEISIRENKPGEAVNTLEALIKNNPSYANGYKQLAGVYQFAYHDSAKSLRYLGRYNEIRREGVQ